MKVGSQEAVTQLLARQDLSCKPFVDGVITVNYKDSKLKFETVEPKKFNSTKPFHGRKLDDFLYKSTSYKNHLIDSNFTWRSSAKMRRGLNDIDSFVSKMASNLASKANINELIGSLNDKISDRDIETLEEKKKLTTSNMQNMLNKLDEEAELMVKSFFIDKGDHGKDMSLSGFKKLYNTVSGDFLNKSDGLSKKLDKSNYLNNIPTVSRNGTQQIVSADTVLKELKKVIVEQAFERLANTLVYGLTNKASKEQQKELAESKKYAENMYALANTLKIQIGGEKQDTQKITMSEAMQLLADKLGGKLDKKTDNIIKNSNIKESANVKEKAINFAEKFKAFFETRSHKIDRLNNEIANLINEHKAKTKEFKDTANNIELEVLAEIKDKKDLDIAKISNIKRQVTELLNTEFGMAAKLLNPTIEKAKEIKNMGLIVGNEIGFAEMKKDTAQMSSRTQGEEAGTKLEQLLKNNSGVLKKNPVTSNKVGETSKGLNSFQENIQRVHEFKVRVNNLYSDITTRNANPNLHIVQNATRENTQIYMDILNKIGQIEHEAQKDKILDILKNASSRINVDASKAGELEKKWTIICKQLPDYLLAGKLSQNLLNAMSIFKNQGIDIDILKELENVSLNASSDVKVDFFAKAKDLIGTTAPKNNDKSIDQLIADYTKLSVDLPTSLKDNELAHELKSRIENYIKENFADINSIPRNADSNLYKVAAIKIADITNTIDNSDKRNAAHLMLENFAMKYIEPLIEINIVQSNKRIESELKNLKAIFPEGNQQKDILNKINNVIEVIQGNRGELTTHDKEMLTDLRNDIENINKQAREQISDKSNLSRAEALESSTFQWGDIQNVKINEAQYRNILSINFSLRFMIENTQEDIKSFYHEDFMSSISQYDVAMQRAHSFVDLICSELMSFSSIYDHKFHDIATNTLNAFKDFVNKQLAYLDTEGTKITNEKKAEFELDIEKDIATIKDNISVFSYELQKSIAENQNGTQDDKNIGYINKLQGVTSRIIRSMDSLHNSLEISGSNSYQEGLFGRIIDKNKIAQIEGESVNTIDFSSYLNGGKLVDGISYYQRKVFNNIAELKDKNNEIIADNTYNKGKNVQLESLVKANEVLIAKYQKMAELTRGTLSIEDFNKVKAELKQDFIAGMNEKLVKKLGEERRSTQVSELKTDLMRNTNISNIQGEVQEAVEETRNKCNLYISKLEGIRVLNDASPELLTTLKKNVNDLLQEQSLVVALAQSDTGKGSLSAQVEVKFNSNFVDILNKINAAIILHEAQPKKPIFGKDSVKTALDELKTRLGEKEFSAFVEKNTSKSVIESSIKNVGSHTYDSISVETWASNYLNEQIKAQIEEFNTQVNNLEKLAQTYDVYSLSSSNPA